jgi:hypothetical protein
MGTLVAGKKLYRKSRSNGLVGHLQGGRKNNAGILYKSIKSQTGPGFNPSAT